MQTWRPPCGSHVFSRPAFCGVSSVSKRPKLGPPLSFCERTAHRPPDFVSSAPPDRTGQRKMRPPKTPVPSSSLSCFVCFYSKRKRNKSFIISGYRLVLFYIIFSDHDTDLGLACTVLVLNFKKKDVSTFMKKQNQSY